MYKLFIGVGSNMGDRYRNIIDAINCIADLPRLTIRSASSVYETEPVGGPPQGLYLNCVIEAESSLPARDLLRELKKIETDMGRQESVRYGPRLIDLDILLYGDLVIEEEDITIPHKELHERAFVLVPLLEIDENLTHPSLHKTLKALLTSLGDSPEVKPYTPPPFIYPNL